MTLAAALLLQAVVTAVTKSPMPAVTDPIVLVRAVTAYPLDALLAHQQGRALVKVRISAKGKPQDCRILTSSGFAAIDKASCAAVKTWAYSPALDAGHQAVEGIVEVPITWRLPQMPAPLSSGNPR